MQAQSQSDTTSTHAAHHGAGCRPIDPRESVEGVTPLTTSPSYAHDDEGQAEQARQRPLDLIDEESMESFPCSDPPSYSACHV